ncbi:threonine/serine exporter family protein [Gemmiger sp.]|uniref:threonine/serine exporter family protein n=1 Tax=Gemmiger sp. TaxID=2049027 RepID=UPI002A7498D4|nr:threonine/serine exporter family protein [Gemmiger sp.]MDY2694516.1 threonine/serine exporter family protein [Gemmiger sp.]MDY6006756.1 threonine/serine exporter family protein [Gemmiger sp.]
MDKVLFTRSLTLVLDAGQTLLENGSEVFRVQQTMEIMARSLGIEDFNVYVLTNGIFASARSPDSSESLTRHVPLVSIHLGRVEAVNELSRELAAGKLNLDEAEQRLQDARALPPAPPRVLRLAGAAGAACFGYLFGGGLAEALVAGIAGYLEVVVSQQLSAHKINRIFTIIVAAVVVTACAISMRLLLLPGLQVNFAIIGALMVLTPGVALTMGIRDILNADYLSGSIRLLDAVLVAGSIACGVAIAWLAARGLGVTV